jgi:hypothetical protein
MISRKVRLVFIADVIEIEQGHPVSVPTRVEDVAVGGLLGSAIGYGNLARYASGEARGWQDEIYVDHLQPWMIYAFRADEDGRSSTGIRGMAARSRLDMYITNAFEEVIRGYISLFGGTVGESEGIKKPVLSDVEGGWMSVRARPSGGRVSAVAENVDVVGSRLGIFQEDIKRSWSRAVCSVPKAPSAANDDESSACNVGNRRVLWDSGSVRGVAA